jgi:hypothetical protein
MGPRHFKLTLRRGERVFTRKPAAKRVHLAKAKGDAAIAGEGIDHLSRYISRFLTTDGKDQ